MSSLRRVLWVVAAFAVVHGVEACSAEEPGAELNPQPLPPQDPGESKGPEDDGRGTAGGASSSSGGSSGAPNADADASDGGDAGDGGADSSGDN